MKGTKTGCEGMGSSCIRHVVTVDNGNTWSNSTMVLNQATVGHYMETFSGKWFPRLFGDRGGGMVLVTDGGANNTLAPFMSYAPGASAMTEIVSAAPGTITTHPPGTEIALFMPFYTPKTTIFLSRQARDKHKETLLQKESSVPQAAQRS